MIPYVAGMSEDIKCMFLPVAVLGHYYWGVLDSRCSVRAHVTTLKRAPPKEVWGHVPQKYFLDPLFGCMSPRNIF